MSDAPLIRLPEREERPAGVRERLFRDVLGDLLRRIRQEQGRTLRDVAGHAQVSVPYLSEIERGRKEASSEVLSALCRSLGIEMGDLVVVTGRELIETSVRRPLDITSRHDHARRPSTHVMGVRPLPGPNGSAFALAA